MLFVTLEGWDKMTDVTLEKINSHCHIRFSGNKVTNCFILEGIR